MPVPPNRPCALRLCRHTFSELSLQGYHSGGVGGITCRRPKKSVKKNILRHENRTIPVLSGSANPVTAMTCAAPKRDAPAALQSPENSPPGSQEPVTDASRTFAIFHGLGANHCCSCPFLQSPSNHLLNNPAFKLYLQGFFHDQAAIQSG